MEPKELQNRLDIIRLAASIGDWDTIVLQNTHLKQVNDVKIDEIITLLESKNYRQALYLIKRYMNENSFLTSDSLNNFDDDSEKVLGVEDMLRMSPLAKETIRDYKSSHYTKDDLESFAKNIEVPIEKEYENKVENSFDNYEEKIQQIQEEVEEKVSKGELEENPDTTEKEDLDEFGSAVESVHKDTPLDEISAEVLGASQKPERKKVLSKYKTLRSKFAKKDKQSSDEPKKTNLAKNVLSKAKNLGDKLKVTEIKNSISKIKEVNKEEDKADSVELDKKVEEPQSKQETPKKVVKQKENEIYPPIPHIEQKFRQAFVLYPPNKESDVWVEEVIKFLKHIASNSYTDSDVESFMNDFDFYLEKGDIARASQVLLLGAATDSKYAQFILARELFSGRVLRRDLKKSYAIMKHLANSFYPDAVCDLAQFYEYGIGVPKDKKVALRLYEKAFELGVDRATKHINRIKESGGILSSILKLK